MKRMLIGLVATLVFGVGPAFAAPPDTLCSEASFDKALYGLCKGYTSGIDCLDPANRDEKRCIVLRQQFASKSGGQDIDAILKGLNGAVSATVDYDGGTIELPRLAKVWFPRGAFDSPQVVTLKTTSDNAVNELFDETASIFRTFGRLPYEFRIGTGDSPPLSDTIEVEMHVPDSLLQAMPSDYSMEVFAGIEQGGAQEIPHTLFELQESSFDPVNQVITFDLPGSAFANTVLTEGGYQAIIILSPTPGSAMSETPEGASLSTLFAMLTATTASSSSCKAASISCPVGGGCAVTSPFSPARAHPVTGVTRPHMGVDYAAADGTPIVSAVNGTIERSYTSSSYGETIVVRHSDGSATLYAHLQTRGVSAGDTVSLGQQIGTAGSTGVSTGPHLHFEYFPNGQIYVSKSRIDPDACIDSLASGSVTVSDTGSLADDAFEASIDGFVIGQTAIGTTNTLAISNIKPGFHTLTLRMVIAPDNVGTYTVTLNDGLAFTDGSVSKTGWAPQGATLSWPFVVPIP